MLFYRKLFPYLSSMFGVSLETIRLETRSQYAKITIFSKNRHNFREYLKNGRIDFRSVNFYRKVLLRATKLPHITFRFELKKRELWAKNQNFAFFPSLGGSITPPSSWAMTSKLGVQLVDLMPFRSPQVKWMDTYWDMADPAGPHHAQTCLKISLKLYNLAYCPKKSERMNLSRDFFGNYSVLPYCWD